MISLVCFKDDIAEAEGGAGVFGTGVTVFPWVEEEIESQPDEVGNGGGFTILSCVGGVCVVEEDEGDWFDTCWGWVCSMI